MTDPIQEAENNVAALRVFEEIAKPVASGMIRVAVHNGKVTSVTLEQKIDPKSLPHARIIADMAQQLGYGGFDFAIIDGRITTLERVERDRQNVA